MEVGEQVRIFFVYALYHTLFAVFYKGSPYQESIPTAVKNSKLEIKYMDQALFHTLKLRFQLGLFDPTENQPYWKVPGSIINNQQHRDLNIFSARCTQTLLKNNNNVLPFDASTIMKNNKIVGIIGPHYNASKDLCSAYTGQICRDGSTNCIQGMLNGVSNYITNSNNMMYAEGCDDGTKCNTTKGIIYIHLYSPFHLLHIISLILNESAQDFLKQWVLQINLILLY